MTMTTRCLTICPVPQAHRDNPKLPGGWPMRIEDTRIAGEAVRSLYPLPALRVQAATMEQDLTVPDGIP